MAFLEVKGMLARLLATENLVVEHSPSAKTACFNVSTRVMVLPIWETNSEEVYNMFVSHEVGHALWTPVDFPEQLQKLKVDPSIVNILEDVRIEKMIQKKFPGLRKDYSLGYRELHDKDLFETQGKDLNKFGLLDRLNLHFKIGATLLVPFSEKEEQFLDKISACETYEDVLRVSLEIQSYVKEHDELDELPLPNGMEETQVDDGSDNEGEQSESSESQNDYSQSKETSSSDNKQGVTDETSTNSQGASNDSSDEPVSPKENEEKEQTPENKKEEPEVGELKSKTQEALDEAMKRMVSNGFHDIVYLNAPTSDPKDIVHPTSSVRDNIDQNAVGLLVNNYRAKQQFEEFQTRTRRDVNHMVQQFEMKKSAEAYARIQVNKTGILNTGQLHNYKLTDDIFLRQETTPDGKSHGMVMLLDWSGSMDHIAMDTIKQILVLVQFCRKVQIPFRVYTFTTGSPYKKFNKMKHRNEPYDRTQMVEVLNSSTKKNQLDKDIFNLFLLGLSYKHRNYSVSLHPFPGVLGMGGTPLINCLFTSYNILKQFKEETSVDKVSFITITDGDSAQLTYINKDGIADSVYSQTVMIRGKNGSVFQLSSDIRQMPGSVAKWISETLPYVSVSNIFLGGHGPCNSYYCGVRGLNRWETNEGVPKAEFMKDKSYTFTTEDNWPLVALLNPQVFGEVAEEIDVAQGASASKVRSAFKKFVGQKASSKKILSALVDSFA